MMQRVRFDFDLEDVDVVDAMDLEDIVEGHCFTVVSPGRISGEACAAQCRPSRYAPVLIDTSSYPDQMAARIKAISEYPRVLRLAWKNSPDAVLWQGRWFQAGASRDQEGLGRADR